MVNFWCLNQAKLIKQLPYVALYTMLTSALYDVLVMFLGGFGQFTNAVLLTNFTQSEQPGIFVKAKVMTLRVIIEKRIVYVKNSAKWLERKHTRH
jgi:hypothetical protein